MSNPRLDDHLVVGGPAPGGAPHRPPRDSGHPVLTEVLRELLEREKHTVGRPIAYYEDSP
ncbi:MULTISPECIES: hypothetical protein [unclassified Streptomyces]|uniref:hypothetical protein n=1 Tax=unclassified Streptomyces TaxID=2593676 RepID=UPI002E2D8192|nr:MULTISPECIES: hypothetical protein [unclassified Streptomyces]WUB85735.1 hypothetical protein OG812_03600 [Streptomyces sp. NBC_00566]